MMRPWVGGLRCEAHDGATKGTCFSSCAAGMRREQRRGLRGLPFCRFQILRWYSTYCRFLLWNTGALPFFLAMEEDEELTAVSRLPPCLPIAAEPGAHRAPPFTESTRVAR